MSDPVTERRGSSYLRRGRIVLAALALCAVAFAFGAPAAHAQVCGDSTIDVGEACDDGNTLDGDCCSSLCAIEPSSVVCRPATGACDVAESCDGVSPTCPADQVASQITVCRAAAGGCDLAEACDGVGVTCPADAVAGAGTVCRVAAGVCDVAEACDGVAAACPADVVVNAGTSCRPSAGVCDVAESCNGTSAACPSDAFAAAPANSASGAAASQSSTDVGTADRAIDGSTDGIFANGSVSRTNAQAEAAWEVDLGAVATIDAIQVWNTTDGTAANLRDFYVFVSDTPFAGPSVADALGQAGASAFFQATQAALPSAIQVGRTGRYLRLQLTGATSLTLAEVRVLQGTVCRVAAGVCDVGDFCDGSGATCSAVDIKQGVRCRAAAGVCDVAESCDGLSDACPADSLQPSTAVCRAAAGVCDIAESCTGSSASCPSDGFTTSGTVCRAAASVCDLAEACSGSSAACPADAVAPSSTVCRVSAGGCDPAETCDGAGVCPGDSLFPNGAICRAPAGPCDISELCNGSSPACPADAFSPSATTCRATAGACDVAETCTGSGAACPADVLVSGGTTCRIAAGACDVAESCDGLSPACPANGFVASGTTCRAAAGVCDVAETCTGASAACPADTVVATGIVCRAAVSNCDAAEACNGTNVTCPADLLIPNGTVCNDGDICSSTSTCSNGTCTGTAAAAGGQVCRPIAGPCDIAETCNGVTPSCPADGYRPVSATCRAAAGTCDLAEQCTGTAVSCPPDAKSTSECRPPANSCDVAEFCDGVGNHCPTNLSQPNGTFCADEGNACTRDTCLNGNCAHTAGNTGALCRAALSTCDVPETCDGVSQNCPSDVTAPDGIGCDDAMSCTGGDACDAGQCIGTSLSCGNGTVECGEECDDNNSNDGDDCSSTCRFTEICSDLIDNEPDGRIDCLDPECSGVCGALVNGGLPPRPSRIIFKRSLDLFRLFGAIAPTPPFNPSTEVFGISISNANGVIFSASLPPGALGIRGDKHWVARNPLAHFNGGLFSVGLVKDTAAAGTVIRFSIVGFGDFTAATLAQMSVQVVLGDYAAMHTSSWEQLKSGWRVNLP